MTESNFRHARSTRFFEPWIRSTSLVVLGSTGLLGGCSWWRYDDITENSPVLLLETPDGTRGLGTSVAALQGQSGSALLFASGLESYSLYDMGTREPRTTDAIDQGTCEPSERCFLSESAAAIHRVVDGKSVACFAFALSTTTNGTPRTELYCEGAKTVGVGLDSMTESQLGKLTISNPPQLKFASAPRKNPQRLVAAVANDSALWYYASPSTGAVALARPNAATASFGRSLALLDARYDSPDAGATVIAGEPESSRVYLLTVDDAGGTSSTRCLEGPTGFGRLLSTGYFIAGGAPGFAFAANDQLIVVPDAGALAQTVPADDACHSIVGLPSVLTLGCRDFGVEVDCESALTRGALAPADLNGDGIDELVVGIPAAFSGGNRAAGQLLTVTITNGGLEIHERLSPSSIESGDRLGESVVAIPLARPDVVLAGAPGGNKLAAFYCSTLLPEGLGGKRCE